MNVLGAILWKDLVSEWRSRDRIVAMLAFALLVVLMFHFALDPAQRQGSHATTGGLLWLTYLFASILGFNRAFALELENEAIAGLALAPVDRGWIFLGKALANFLLLAVVQVVVAFVFVLTFGLRILPVAGPLAGIVALGSLGLCSLGTLFGAISAHTRYREVMLPLLMLPLTVPVLVGAVRATTTLLAEGSASFPAVQLLIVTDATFLLMSTILFEYVLEE